MQVTPIRVRRSPNAGHGTPVFLLLRCWSGDYKRCSKQYRLMLLPLVSFRKIRQGPIA